MVHVRLVRTAPPRRRGLAIIAAAAAAIVGLSACGSSGGGTAAAKGTGGESSGASSPTQTLSINYYQGVDVSVVPWVAQEAGIFKKDGLDVKLVPTTNGPATTSALLSGDLDMITNQVPGMMQLLDQGKDVKAVTGIYSAYPFSIVAAKSVSTANAGKFPQALEALKGKTFGVDAIGGVTYNIIRAFMKSAGMSPDDTKFVAIGTTAQLATALQNGQIDAFNALPTDVFRLVDIGHQANELIDFGTSGPPEFSPWQLSAYFATSQTLASKPQAFKDFQKAWTDTVAYMKDPSNSTSVNKIVGTFLNLQPDQAGTLMKKILPLLGGGNSAKAFDNISKFLVSAGVIKKPVDGASAIWKG